MKKIQILWDFIRLSVTEKVAFYRNVIAKLTDNPTYPSPPISLIDAKTAVDTLDASIIAARDGSHFAVATIHDNEKVADGIFRAVANYVESTADGDETKIINSGFHGTKQPTPIQKATLAVVDGLHSGSVKLIAKAVIGGEAYIFQMTKGKPTPESVWLPVTTTLYTTYTVEGLEPACYYSFRVAAVVLKHSGFYSVLRHYFFYGRTKIGDAVRRYSLYLLYLKPGRSGTCFSCPKFSR